VLVRGTSELLLLDNTNVVKKGLHKFYFLHRSALLSSCVDFVVFMVEASVWRDSDRVSALAQQLKKLAHTAHRVAPSSTVLVCTIQKKEAFNAAAHETQGRREGFCTGDSSLGYDIPEGFPYNETGAAISAVLPMPVPAALEPLEDFHNRACDGDGDRSSESPVRLGKTSLRNLHGPNFGLQVKVSAAALDASNGQPSSLLSPTQQLSHQISKKVTMNLQGRKRDLRIAPSTSDSDAESTTAASILSPKVGVNPLSPMENPLSPGGNPLSPGGCGDTSDSAVPILLMRVDDHGQDPFAEVALRLSLMIEKSDVSAEDAGSSGTPRKGRRLKRGQSVALKKMQSVKRMLVAQGRVSHFGASILRKVSAIPQPKEFNGLIPSPVRSPSESK
jgi:hypothetical protein